MGGLGCKQVALSDFEFMFNSFKLRLKRNNAYNRDNLGKQLISMSFKENKC